ncbi:hypothetical protein [Methylocapsa palsarum]|uniref:Uncharacterized protein n=1 Tax=Methylocapsa palsarum TaxID=1612308 RepID=A0A1I3YLX5_9HYPH|nr:hypothetical protein [Methylocapsa palsarum]SFK32773.1 hypothetical protein SAMN05444581_10636 [Methylocapsa palsarum]
MFRLLARFAALVLSAIAFAALIVDGATSFSAGRLIVTPLDQAATALAPIKTAALYSAVEKHLPAFVFDPVLATLPHIPVWLAIGLIALVLFRLGREAPPEFGYSSR